MDIIAIIIKQLKKRGKVRVADIVKATGFSRAYINKFFLQLKKEGKIFLIGRTNKAHYVLAEKKSIEKARKDILEYRRVLFAKNLAEDVVLGNIKKETGIFAGLLENVSNILDYAFTEMLNNAIEHSRSEKIAVEVRRRDSEISFRVADKGIGIYNNIMQKRGLNSEMEAIQDLLKGKQTTAPEEHSGEGIFFTSKVGDRLIIRSRDKSLIFDNLINDIFIKDIKPIKGTIVDFKISAKANRNLNEIFKEYSQAAFGFDATKVVVDLYKIDTDYISRSQARRILAGLDKFKIISLDFKDVQTVGQAFADEVFRVWQKRHPGIKIKYQNANENIEFMIRRSLTP